jgi:hypothetical protein
VNLIIYAVIVVAAAGLAVAAVLIVRRRAPEGGFFNDSDRAAGVFGVLATGFTLLLGFIVFLAFTSYDQSRVGAEREALVTAQQVETAQFLPQPTAGELTGQLVCYARSVVYVEWPLMEAGDLDAEINPWGIELFHSLQGVQPASASEEAAYGKWLDQTSDREEARTDRVHGADGIIPVPLWVAMGVIALIIFGYVLLFADSGEPAVIQGIQVGGVVSVMVVLLLLLSFLNDPYGPDVGGLKPTAMERTLVLMDQAMQVTPAQEPIPCDELGNKL